MSKIEVNTITQQCGPTLTVGGGACKSVTVDATTVTLGKSGGTVSLAAGATQSGFGRTGTVDWCTTAKTAPFTGVSGKGYFVNTTSGVITVTLPATPTGGDIVSLKDYGGTWQNNNVTLCNNGSKINGVADVSLLKTQSQSVTLIYVDATKGWQVIQDSSVSVTGGTYMTATGGTVTTCGDYKTHIFTSSGNFIVNCISTTPANNVVDYLVVAGGGGSGTSCAAGGGGAGGFRVSNGWGLPAPSMSPLSACVASLPVSATTYPITIGAGGSGSPYSGPATVPAPGSIGTDGSPSVFSTITSTGGGKGGGSPCVSVRSGSAGGSGGGGSHNGGTGGAGNTPPTTPIQGNNGTTSVPSSISTDDEGGGGGGAGAVGGNPAGGVGSYVSNSFLGVICAPSYGDAGPVPSVRYFSGGGGGGARNGPNGPIPAASIAGGSGGGGRGGYGPSNTAGVAGTVNTGGGAGGSTQVGAVYAAGLAGGSGFVAIRYKYQ